MSWHNFCTGPKLYNKYFQDASAFAEEIMSEHMSKKNIQTQEPKPSHITCKNCGSNKIWIDVKQVRSGDEGATTFCKCFVCNKRWTMN